MTRLETRVGCAANRGAKALLLAAGKGKRLLPITKTLPKCLVPIAGRPLLEYWLERFDSAGIREVTINTHHLAECVRERIARVNSTGRLQVREAYEPELLGSAGTVRANRGLADDTQQVLIVYADNLSNMDLAALWDYHRSHEDPLTVALFRAPDPSRCGIVDLDSQGRIQRFVEKPARSESDLANAGVYALTSQAYREIADMGEFDLARDVLPRFVGRMRGWLWRGYHRDIGTLDALERARREAPRIFGTFADPQQ